MPKLDNAERNVEVGLVEKVRGVCSEFGLGQSLCHRQSYSPCQLGGQVTCNAGQGLTDTLCSLEQEAGPGKELP